MSIFEALLLGIIQGITEFLPISSSGHLALFQSLFGYSNLSQYLLFDLVVHLGTLFAILVVFRKEILRLLTEDKNRLLQLLVAITPLFPLLLIMKPIKAIFENTAYLGPFFMTTGLIILFGIKFGSNKQESNVKTWRDPLLIGAAQAFAIFPGVSRSGTTVSASRLLGWNYQQALAFSFLLAIPTILGAVSIESIKVITSSEPMTSDVFAAHYLIGFFSAFVVGIGALNFLIKLGNSDKWMIFVWYCLILGFSTTIYFNYVT